MNIRLTPRALSDLDAVFEYLSAEAPSMSHSTERGFRTAFSVISAFPEVGRQLRDRVRRYTLTRQPYLIFYRIDVQADTIEVITIRHAARNPAPWAR